jgi:hypothetical protein
MKKKASFSRKLPAFIVTPTELERLVVRLGSQLGDKFEVTINIEVKNEEWTFNSFAELHSATDLPNVVTAFKVWLRTEGRDIRIRTDGMWGIDGAVDADAEDAVWCIGVVESARQLMRAHRRWYSWIRGWPIGAAVVLLFLLPISVAMTPYRSVTNAVSFYIAWGILFIVFWSLYIFRGRLLPPGTILLRQTDSFLRRYLPEITLLLSMAALAATIVGWFVR